MSDMHLTRDLMAAVARGDLPPRVVVEVAYQHLLSLCPVCRAEVETWQRRRPQPGDYAKAFARLRERLRSEDGAAPEADKQEAGRWLDELRSLPQPDWIGTIEGSPRRFRGQAFAEILLGESKAALPGKPEESYHLAHCAETVLHRSGIGPGELPLFAHAVALAGNARRAIGDLEAADKMLSAARLLVERCGVTDTLVCAEIDALEGVLRKDQRRFVEARELLTRSSLLFQRLQETTEAARACLGLATLCHEEGAPEEAMEVISSAIGLLDPETEPNLYLLARFELAYSLHTAGRHREAQDHLDSDADRYQACDDPQILLHRRWLGAKIASELGEAERAESELRAVREAFSQRPLDQAHISLDLALLYLRQGRLGDVKQVATEAVSLFETQGVHREALAALMLFKEAAEAEQLTIDSVRKLSRYFEQVGRRASIQSPTTF